MKYVWKDFQTAKEFLYFFIFMSIKGNKYRGYEEYLHIIFIIAFTC